MVKNHQIPDDVGVQVEVEGALANVEAPGLDRENNTCTNDALGSAATALRPQITTGVGNVRLIEVANE